MSTVVVSNLNDQVDEQLLFEMFSHEVTPKYIKFPEDVLTQKRYGRAFVSFYTKEDAQTAIFLFNRISLYGQEVQMKIADQDQSASKIDEYPYRLYVKGLTDKTVAQLAIFGPSAKLRNNVVGFLKKNDAEQVLEQQSALGIHASWARK